MKPILFNTEMVKAILEGRKTSTRRITKYKPYTSLDETNGEFEICEPVTQNFFKCRSGFEKFAINQCRYKVGDILYVRETWSLNECWNCDNEYCDKSIEYKDKRGCFLYNADNWTDDIKWHPSIHMPKEAARIFLKVTDVRVERVQDITIIDLTKEGFGNVGHSVDVPWYEVARQAFSVLWNSLYCNWNENPWVWIIEFERTEAK